jgi:hypothetical protein
MYHRIKITTIIKDCPKNLPRPVNLSQKARHRICPTACIWARALYFFLPAVCDQGNRPFDLKNSFLFPSSWARAFFFFAGRLCFYSPQKLVWTNVIVNSTQRIPSFPFRYCYLYGSHRQQFGISMCALTGLSSTSGMSGLVKESSRFCHG